MTYIQSPDKEMLASPIDASVARRGEIARLEGLLEAHSAREGREGALQGALLAAEAALAEVGSVPLASQIQPHFSPLHCSCHGRDTHPGLMAHPGQSLGRQIWPNCFLSDPRLIVSRGRAWDFFGFLAEADLKLRCKAPLVGRQAVQRFVCDSVAMRR